MRFLCGTTMLRTYRKHLVMHPLLLSQASALIELSTLVDDGQVYFDYAEKLLKSLSSDVYLAKVGTNQGFILMHSTGSLPNGSEIDTPINYADYYYLEALTRYMQVKGIDYKSL